MPTTKTGIYVLSKNKCGTTLIKKIFFRMVNDMEEYDLLSYQDPEPLAKRYNVISKWDRQHKIKPNRNFCCALARDFQIDIVEHDNYNVKYLFHIRDPKDILVSQYYSYGWTHSTKFDQIPNRSKIQNMTVDEYCLEASDDLLVYFSKLKNHVYSNNNTYIISYEEMIFDFYSWLNKALMPFELANTVDLVDKYFEIFYKETIPPITEQMVHKRKVWPGDHCRLEQKTIKELNDKFKDITTDKRIFNYEYQGYYY